MAHFVRDNTERIGYIVLKSKAMSSRKEYLEFVLSQLEGLREITYKPMMGEYILYFQGKVIGGIYDDRLLVKPTKSARSLMPQAAYAKPYTGAKDMLLVDAIDNRDFLHTLFQSMLPELPQPKTKKRIIPPLRRG